MSQIVAATAQPTTIHGPEREALILRHMVVVDALVRRFVAAGIPRCVDPRDLAQVGYLEMVRTITSTPDPRGIRLDKRVAAHVRRELVRFLEREALWRDRVSLGANYEEIAFGALD